MTPETYGTIHESVNLSVVLMVEIAAVWTVWWVLPILWQRLSVSLVVFLAVLYLGHRLIPKITGPVIDRFLRH